MTFDDLWREVQGLPEMAITQVPRVLSESAKKKLMRKAPEEISRIVAETTDEVNNGSEKPLDDLIFDHQRVVLDTSAEFEKIC